MLTTEWKIYIYVCEKIVNISYQFFQKKKMSKNLYASLRYECYTCMYDVLFHKIQGNGVARGPSHIVILFNPLRPKSDLNKIYHSNRIIS